MKPLCLLLMLLLAGCMRPPATERLQMAIPEEFVLLGAGPQGDRSFALYVVRGETSEQWSQMIAVSILESPRRSPWTRWRPRSPGTMSRAIV